MAAFEQLEEVLTLDQAQELVGPALFCAREAPQSTQQLLDDLLGHFDDDDSAMVLSFSAESYSGFDE